MRHKITMPTARKSHVCYLCKQPIAKGEQYVKIAQLSPEFTSTAIHCDCEQIMQNLCSDCSWRGDCDIDMHDCWASKKHGEEKDK